MNDNLPLIVAHLLGGTTGLNLHQAMDQDEIEIMVAAAVRVAVEILRQVDELKL